MRTRSLALGIAGMLAILGSAAHADPKADIVAKTRSAMASYDAMDYDAARRQLNQALAVAKKARLEKDPVVARVYLDLGIAQLAGSDQEAARSSFLQAAQIDPKITVDPGYKTSELVRMVEEAKTAAVSGGRKPVAGSTEEPESDGVDCAAVRGLQHTVIETARPGVAQPIEAIVNSDLSPARVVVMYRPEGAIDFTEAKLTKQGGCRYVGSIPGSAMHGSVVHYYVAAYDIASKALAAKGTSGSPNLITLGGAAASRPPDDTVISPGNSGGGSVPTIASHAPEPDKGSSFELSVNVGTGVGYVTGVTEAGNNVKTNGVGTSLVVVSPEIAYHTSRQFSIGLAFRLGLPLGANIDGHSTSAPAGFVRLRYAFSRSGDGVRIMGEAGVGVLRNTLKINATADMPGMDTDVVAEGPLLFGLGVGYKKHLNNAFAFLAELDALGGIAVADKLGSAIHLNTGFAADLTLGLSVGF